MAKKQLRNSAYYEDRLKRDHASIYADLKAGKYQTVTEAAIAAGLKTRRTRLHELKNAWEKASPYEQREFERWLHTQYGATMPHPAPLLQTLRRGDTLTVWRLDRLGRSLFELLKLIRDLNERGVEFRSLSESLDTSTSAGRLLLHVLASMAEFERSLISERTRAGMAAARARGSRIGRRPAMTDEQRQEARLALADGSATVDVIAERHGIHPRTLLRTLKADDRRQDATV